MVQGKHFSIQANDYVWFSGVEFFVTGRIKEYSARNM